MPSPSRFTKYEGELQGPTDEMDVIGYSSETAEKERPRKYRTRYVTSEPKERKRK